MGVGGGVQEDLGPDAPAVISVTSDQIAISGPTGFCVDPTSTRESDDTAFVILGNCAAVSGQADAPQPAVPALLTAAVSDRAGADVLDEPLDTLAEFFTSSDGRRLLSRSGNPNSVEILETRVERNMLFIHARDTSAGAFSGVAEDYWRAYMEVEDRLATLSVLALEEAAVTDEDALATLSDFASAVRRANRGGTRLQSAAPAQQGETQTGGGLFQGGFFDRIFR